MAVAECNTLFTLIITVLLFACPTRFNFRYIYSVLSVFAVSLVCFDRFYTHFTTSNFALFVITYFLATVVPHFTQILCFPPAFLFALELKDISRRVVLLVLLFVLFLCFFVCCFPLFSFLITFLAHTNLFVFAFFLFFLVRFCVLHFLYAWGVLGDPLSLYHSPACSTAVL